MWVALLVVVEVIIGSIPIGDGCFRLLAFARNYTLRARVPLTKILFYHSRGFQIRGTP